MAETPSPISKSHAPLLSPTRIVLVVAVVIGLCSGILLIDRILSHASNHDSDSTMLWAVRLVLVMVTVGITAVVVGWIIRWGSPALLRADGSDQLALDTYPNPRETASRNSAWLIRMRWIAIVITTALIIFATQSTSVINPAALWPLLSIVAVLAAVNVVYPYLAASNRFWQINIRVQVIVDLLLLVLLLHYSGGVENPLSVFLVLHVIIGGILLDRSWCYTVAGIASVLYTSLIWLEWIGWLPHHPLHLYSIATGTREGLDGQIVFVSAQTSLHVAMLLLIAVFVGTLGDHARNNENRLRTFAQNARADHRLLEQVIETTHSAIRVVDRDIQPTLSNARWQEWTREYVPETTNNQCDDLDTLAVRTMGDGKLRVSQFSIPPAPGEADDCTRIIRLTTAALGHREGRVEQVVQFAQDITELSRHHEQMVRAGQLAAVGELAGQVAHEVNNPIAIISAKARLIIANHRAELSEKTASDLAKIIDLSDRVAKIAQGLLTSCRPTPGELASEDLCPIVRNAVALIKARARAIGVTIETNLSGPPANAFINLGQMQQVVLNILLNAIDAMPHGGTLRITCQRHAQELSENTPTVAIIIDDSGDGIDPAIREKVFEPFFSTKQDGVGTGLGLSICRGIVQSFSGQIEISKAPIGGARLTIRLPRNTPRGETPGAQTACIGRG